MPLLKLFLSICLFLALAITSEKPLNAQENPLSWNQWRGPARNCQFIGPEWPNSISKENLTQNWEVKLGPSYSGPVVSEEAVFVTETANSEFEVVRALDRNTGKQKWESRWKGAMEVPFFAAANGSWIRATPVLDEGRLYVAGMRDVLVCLDSKSGELIWKVDFVAEYGSPLPAFGFASSPLVVGEFVYVQAGGGVVKLNKLNGKIVWRKLADGGGMSGSAFSSPAVAEINGKPELLVQTRKKLIGLDLETGETLWSQEVPAFRGMNILTPTCFENGIYTSSYGGGSFLFAINRKENGETITEQWNSKAQAYMSSPVLIDGHLYVHLRNKRFCCIDWKTGEELWRTKPFGKYWSMVYQGNRILALDERGDLLLVNANPKAFELVSKVHITDEPTWAHIAMINNEIFIRSLNSQISYSWK